MSDIEFRWIRHKGPAQKGDILGKPVMGNGHPMAAMTLQYRKSEGGYVLAVTGDVTHKIAWSDWQDVPVVEAE